MKNTKMPDFIVIDDDYINNLICQKMIQITLPGADVQTFIDPEEGLKFIASKYAAPEANNAVLFLDINMPALMGWEVLDIFAGYAETIKQRFTIYVLSSSVDPTDNEQADNNPLVRGYISKALSQATLRGVFPELLLSVS
jgi:CheY-like chemotaxis protein